MLLPHVVAPQLHVLLLQVLARDVPKDRRGMYACFVFSSAEAQGPGGVKRSRPFARLKCSNANVLIFCIMHVAIARSNLHRLLSMLMIRWFCSDFLYVLIQLIAIASR